VRELQNAIERAVTVCEDEEIDVCHLPASVLRRAPIAAQTNSGHSENQNMIDAVEQFERAMILSALEKAYWNKTQAAKYLGVTRRILAYKMQNLGIEKANGEREL